MDGPMSIDSIMSMITSVAGIPSGDGQRSTQQNELLAKIREALVSAFKKNPSGIPNLQEVMSLASGLLSGTGNSDPHKMPDLSHLTSLLGNLGGNGSPDLGHLGSLLGNLGGNGSPDLSQLSSMIGALGGSDGKLPDFGALLSSLTGSQPQKPKEDPSLNKLSSVLSDIQDDDEIA